MEYSRELYHHGILGQRWGQKNGPPYPLKASDHSSSEKKAGWENSLSSNDDEFGLKKISGISQVAEKRKESYIKEGTKRANLVLKKFSNRKLIDDSHINSEGNTNLKEVLGLSDEQAEKIKKYAKIAGISLATAAGIALVGYIVAKQPQLIESGYNNDRFIVKSLNLGPKLFNNISNGKYVGTLARENGYIPINGEVIKHAIANPSKRIIDYNKLVKSVRLDQITDGTVADFSAQRRLSCWSASQSYWLSGLTGRQFTSKSFENLVNFNDFGKLYTKNPKIYTASGRRSLLFVGKFGEKSAQASEKTAKVLVENIFKRVNANNNLTPDGMKTLGFINGGYHHTTCTHEWNFEMLHNLNGTKSLVMADGYTGKRFFVGNLLSTGKIDYDADGFAKLVKELSHYNAKSLRFYAPSLQSVNAEMLSKVILGKL